MDAGGAGADFRTERKPAVPIGPRLREYLAREGREVALPVSYERLRGYDKAVPLLERDGTDTLWEPSPAASPTSSGESTTWRLRDRRSRRSTS